MCSRDKPRLGISKCGMNNSTKKSNCHWICTWAVSGVQQGYTKGVCQVTWKQHDSCNQQQKILLQLVCDESGQADGMGHTGTPDTGHRCASQLQLQLGLRRAESESG